MLLGWKKIYANIVFLFGKIFRLNVEKAIGINEIILQHLVYSATANCALKIDTESCLWKQGGFLCLLKQWFQMAADKWGERCGTKVISAFCWYSGWPLPRIKEVRKSRRAVWNLIPFPLQPVFSRDLLFSARYIKEQHWSPRALQASGGEECLTLSSVLSVFKPVHH